MRERRGLLITLEGIDGAGKTTIARILEQRFPDLVFTREPTDSLVGDLAKRAEDPLEQLFLFVADHAHHLNSCVIPAIEAGRAVISDRYTDSRVAYQGALLKGMVSIEWIYEIHRPWSMKPDLTLLFRIDPEVAVVRCMERDVRNTHPIFEREAFLRDVSRNFDILASREPERFVIIDAEQDISEVARTAISEIERILRR